MLGQSRGHSAGSGWISHVIPTESLSWSVLLMRGRDALSFAQGQFSQEVAEESRPTLLLQPSGEVLSAGWIRASNEEVRYLLPTSLLSVSHQRLQRFLLRVDVVLDSHSDQEGPYWDRASLFASEWPGVEELSATLPPHSFGSAFVAATVSFKKGCFTGQELVGRADARGATMPWRFASGMCQNLTELAGDIQSCGPAGPQGITSWYEGTDGTHWRAIVHRTWTSSGTDVVLQFRA